MDLCEEFQLRPAQMRFPHPRHRLWTWMHPSGSTHQLDHILINNKLKNSLRNCRAYNSVDLDSDHRIVSIRLVCTLRTSRAKPCKRPKFYWKKLQDAATKEQFQLELSNRFDVLQCNNMSTPITERYESFENAVEEVAEKVVGRCSPCGTPSWVSDRTKQLRTEREMWPKMSICFPNLNNPGKLGENSILASTSLIKRMKWQGSTNKWKSSS